MHLSQNLLSKVFLVLLVGVVLASRFSKGKAVPTPDGLSFPMKPMYSVFCFVALPVCYVLSSYGWWRVSHQFSWPMTAFYAGLLIVIISRLPGTIVLSGTGIEQRFWFLKKKTILYTEVMAFRKTWAGSSITVLGDNRVRIVHSDTHSDQAAFLLAIEERTGKRAVV